MRGSQRNGGGVWERMGEDLEVSGTVKRFAGIKKDFGVRDEHLGIRCVWEAFGTDEGVSQEWWWCLGADGRGFGGLRDC